MNARLSGFMESICSVPEDDGPRLICADYLDEQGDPRGEFIRTQIALHQLPNLDRRRSKLQRIEVDMLNRYGERWTASHAGWAGGGVFRRGFVHEINMSARQFLARAEELLKLEPIQHVHLLDAENLLSHVLKAPEFERLTGLSVYAQHLGEPLARTIAESLQSSRLTLLHLGRNEIGSAGFERLMMSPHCATIENLDLSDNELDESTRLITLPEGLRQLELHGNVVSPGQIETMLESTDRVQFDYLGLSRNRISGTRLATMHHPARLLEVGRLDLAENGLNAEDIHEIIGDTEPASIRELNLNGNPLGEAGARSLAESSALRRLQVLRLSNTQLTDAGLRAIVESSYLSQLLALDVSNNPLGDDGLQTLLESPMAYHLRQLVFPGIGISFRTRLALEEQFPRNGWVSW